MANGGFEIPVEIKPQIVESQKSTQQYFTDLAAQGSAAVNKVAREAGQPITQEVRFEVQDGKLQASIRNTSKLQRQMEAATQRALKAEAALQAKNAREAKAQRKAQIRQIEQIRKAEFARLKEVEARAVAARKKEEAAIKRINEQARKQLAIERQIAAERRNAAAAIEMGLAPQKGSLAYAERRLQASRERLNNINQGTAAYGRQQKRVKRLTAEVNRLQGASKQSGLAIVSGFLKAQAVMYATMATLNLIQDGLRKMGERRDMIDSMTTSFKAFGLTAEDAARGLESNLQVAMTYGADLNSLDKTLRRITPAITLMGGSMTDAQNLTEALAKRTALLGLNTEQTGRYLEAFAQVMGKGKLQSEELNQQFSELDGALRGQLEQVLRSEYGIENLNEAMQKGEVRAFMFANAFSQIVAGGKGLNELKFDSFEELMDQLKEGEITLKQFNALLNTMHLDNLKNIGKIFGDTLRSVKELQLALIRLFDSENAKWFFDIIDKGIRTLVFAAKGLILAILYIGKLLSELPQKIEGWPVIGAAFKWLTGIVDGAGREFMILEESVTLALDELLGMPEKTERAGSGIVKLQGRVKSLGTELDETARKLEMDSAGIDNALAVTNARIKAEQAVLSLKMQVAEQDLEKAETEKARIAAAKRIYKLTKAQADLELEAAKAAIQAAEQKATIAVEELKIKKQLVIAEMELAKAKGEDVEGYVKAAAEADQALKLGVAMLDTQKKISEQQLIGAKAVHDAADAAAKMAYDQNKVFEGAKGAENASAGYANNMERAADAAERMASASKTFSQSWAGSQEAINAVLSKSKFGVQSDNGDYMLDMGGRLQQFGHRSAQRVINEIQEQIHAYDQLIKKEKELQQASNVRLTGGLAGARAAGGAVAGGSTYQVNELGREGFLSASGRMTEINVPAFGSWKAPTSGEVIPAHVWSELKAARANSMSNRTPAGLGGASGRASGASGSIDNSRVTNHVTIQSQTPVQTASELMVATAKRRRRRFR